MALDTPAPNTADTIRASLAAYPLRPGASDQLVKLCSDDYANLSPAVVADLVRQRMSTGDYQHFMNPSAAADPGQRFAASLKQSVDRHSGRTSGAPGLAGNYGA